MFILKNKKCFFCKKDFLNIPEGPFNTDIKRNNFICSSHALKLNLKCSSTPQHTYVEKFSLLYVKLQCQK
jgi:hypothetical protein